MKEILGLIALAGIGVFFYTKYRGLKRKKKVELQTN